MITFKDAQEILYQVKHHTGIRFHTNEFDLANFLVGISVVYSINNENISEFIRQWILTIYDTSKEKHFNWN